MLGSVTLGSLGIAATLFSIYRLSQSATLPETADPHYVKMLSLTLIGLAVLLFVTLWQIATLVHHLRKHHVGARLSLSFALRMLLAALVPIGIIGVFSWSFLSYDLGKTFNSRVAITLQDALQLTRTSITLRANQALEQTRTLANLMVQMKYTDVVSTIEPLRQKGDLIELAEFDHQGNLVAFAHRNPAVMTVAPPTSAALIGVNEGEEYFEFTSDEENDYTIKVLAKIDKPDLSTYYLQAIYAMPPRFNTLADSVRENYRQYQSYNYLEPHITTSLLLVLGLILALTILTALWISTIFGESMTRPLRELIQATQKVTSGDFRTAVTVMPNNDLGTLGNNFNIMLTTLREAEEMNKRIQAQLTEKNTFLDSILDNITAGVVTFDWRGRLQTVNQAAAAILDSDMTRHFGHRPLVAGQTPEDTYDEMMLGLGEELGKNIWHHELTLSRFSERRIIICRGSRLPGQNSKNRGGQVIVFEDVTEFQQNQRNAAWEEVARRLAHEIKNPLTPIRLQSERLQRKLGGKLETAHDRHLLERATRTIIGQVEAMQQLVRDFSQFAKPLEIRRQAIDPGALLGEIAELYRESPLTLDIQEALPPVAVGPGQLRQVMLNLTKNALEACAENTHPQILWRAWRDDRHLIVSVEDNGPGFQDLSKDPFEPYVTNKSRGSGLGLAIVKKIISEHQGTIKAGHGKRLNGAKITFTLPIEETHE